MDARERNGSLAVTRRSNADARILQEASPRAIRAIASGERAHAILTCSSLGARTRYKDASRHRIGVSPCGGIGTIALESRAAIVRAPPPNNGFDVLDRGEAEEVTIASDWARPHPFSEAIVSPKGRAEQ